MTSSDIQPFVRSTEVARPAGRLTRVGRARKAASDAIELATLDAVVAKTEDELVGEREKGKVVIGAQIGHTGMQMTEAIGRARDGVAARNAPGAATTESVDALAEQVEGVLMEMTLKGMRRVSDRK